MKYPAKKLYKGYVSVRSNIVSDAVRNNEDLEIFFDGEVMVIPHLNLLTHGRIGKDTFKSKFDEVPYRLVDYKWKPVQTNKLL